MESKDKYYEALVQDKGQLNEIDLGDELGLNEDETHGIIAQLLSEHKIKYETNKSCNYRINTTAKKRNK